jgi:hypothetical protein
MKAKCKPRVIIKAVVTRADGRIEDMGIVADSKNGSVIGKLVNKLKGSVKNGCCSSSFKQRS